MRTQRLNSRRVLIITLIIAIGMLANPSLGGKADLSMFGDQEETELVTVASAFSVTSAQPGQTYAAAVVITIKPGWHINSARPYQDWLIPAKLSFDTIPGLTPHSIVYPEGFDATFIDEKISVYGGRTIVRFQVTVDEKASSMEFVLPVRFTYQACNDKECRIPQTVEADLQIIVGSEGQPINEDIFGAVYAQPIEEDIATPPVNEENDLQRLISEYGFWGYILALGIAFITGLLLSFSPCTYPMVPITVSIFAGQDRTVGRGFILSLLYVGSMAIMYGIMGLVISLVGGIFGAWMASPPVVIVIAAVLVIFALSMFGLYELQVPSSLRQKLGTTTKGGGGVGSSIVLGVIAALVVSPCVGPFVAGILLYVATTGSPLVGFLVLFMFALGLGTLYVIIGTFSTAINRLPGSGTWMESVKKFFGFILLLMALYFLRTIMSPIVTAVIAGLLLIAFGVFGGGLDRLTPETTFFPRLKKFLGILALVLGMYLLVGTFITQGLILPMGFRWSPVIGVSDTTNLIDWETDLEAGLARARMEGKPVLIDTWATWCANCRVLDNKTFGDPRVVHEAARFVPIKVQLESLRTPITKNFMARFGLKHYSLPTTLLLDSTGTVRHIIRGVVGPDEMIDQMRKVH
ncbi:MAG: cytochrome c biogenesis protein CcdA [Candidatus Zixiibacteriota bacterium]